MYQRRCNGVRRVPFLLHEVEEVREALQQRKRKCGDRARREPVATDDDTPAIQSGVSGWTKPPEDLEQVVQPFECLYSYEQLLHFDFSGDFGGVVVGEESQVEAVEPSDDETGTDGGSVQRA